jgi:hypothetical protein
MVLAGIKVPDTVLVRDAIEILHPVSVVTEITKRSLRQDWKWVSLR